MLKTLIYYRDSSGSTELTKIIPPEEYRPIFEEYYRGKKVACWEKCYECYVQAEAVLSAEGEHETEERQAHHARLLDRLIELAKKLSLGEDIWMAYATRAAVVRTQPLRRLSEVSAARDPAAIVVSDAVAIVGGVGDSAESEADESTTEESRLLPEAPAASGAGATAGVTSGSWFLKRRKPIPAQPTDVAAMGDAKVGVGAAPSGYRRLGT